VGVPVGAVEEAEIVLWEEWGPRAARIRLISPSTFHSTIVHPGQPWLSLDDKLVIHDLSTARVLGSRAARGEGATVAHRTLSGSPAHLRYNNNAEKTEDGAATVLVLVLAQPRTHGHGRSQVQSGGLGSSNGMCFGEDVVSFIETRVDVRGRAGDMVLTDERLITFVCISLLCFSRELAEPIDY
jgi:hypothetical protein